MEKTYSISRTYTKGDDALPILKLMQSGAIQIEDDALVVPSPLSNLYKPNSPDPNPDLKTNPNSNSNNLHKSKSSPNPNSTNINKPNPNPDCDPSPKTKSIYKPKPKLSPNPNANPKTKRVKKPTPLSDSDPNPKNDTKTKPQSKTDPGSNVKKDKKGSLYDGPISASQLNCRICFRCGSHLHSTSDCQNASQKCMFCQTGRQCNVVSSRTKLIKALKGQDKLTKRIEPLFDSIFRDGHKPSLESCSFLLTELCRYGEYIKAEARLMKMSEAGIKLDSVCYNIVINGYCERGCIEDALRVFRLMKEEKCEATTSTFNTLIKGYGLVGNTREAKQLLDEMDAQNKDESKPNVRTYNILINAFCINDELDEAWDLIQVMRSKCLVPNVVTYNTMAKAFTERGIVSKAESVVREMQILGLHPTEYTCGIVMNGLCEEGHMEKALELVERMNSQGFPPNVVIFNTLIKGYARALLLDGIDEVLEMMDLYRVKPNLQTFSIMMDSWCSVGAMERAKLELERMEIAGICPDVTAYGILMKGFVRAQEPSKAELMLESMQKQGLAPNVVVYTTIISGWCNVGKMEEALRVYYRMVGENVHPNLRTFKTLIWGFSEAKLPNRAEDVLQLMEEQKVSPDDKVLEMIADAWSVIGLQKEASRFLASQKGNIRLTLNSTSLEEPGNDVVPSLDRRLATMESSRPSRLFASRNPVSTLGSPPRSSLSTARMKNNVWKMPIKEASRPNVVCCSYIWCGDTRHTSSVISHLLIPLDSYVRVRCTV